MFIPRQVVMISTKKETNIFKNSTNSSINSDYNDQFLYFLSSNRIYENTWYINLETEFIGQEVSNYILSFINLNPQKFKKIIATTDPKLIKAGIPKISNDFVDKFCTVGNISKTLVEYEYTNKELIECVDIIPTTGTPKGWYKLKIVDNVVITKEIKD